MPVLAILLIPAWSRQCEGEEIPADLDQSDETMVTFAVVGLVHHDDRRHALPGNAALRERGWAQQPTKLHPSEPTEHRVDNSPLA